MPAMTVILTHEKADFDAVASQLGARKLSPEGIALLPRSVNRNVQQFLNLYWDALPFTRAEEWRRRLVDDVVLVDTQSLGSIRGMAKRPRVRVVDHHTIQTERPGWEYQVEPVGATTTLLVEKMQESGLRLTGEEATLLLLGIYEDTGSLTYDTTTVRDARAAAWLLEQGAQLSVARRFLNVALSDAQQALYDDLLRGTEWLRLKERQIVLASAVVPDGFEDEISSVAHRLRETLTPDALFVLVQLGDGVQVVARSSSEAIDVGEVARVLGGGGHSRAAAAMVVGGSADSVRERLRAALPESIQPVTRVESIMSHGLVTILDSALVSEAAALMQRQGHEGYPVVSAVDGEIVGLLTRRNVDRAMSHELGHLPVGQIMLAGQVSVTPDDSLEAVQRLMATEGWGQIPVLGTGDGGDTQPIGIVTRTDVLNALSLPAPSEPEPDVRLLLARSFSPELWALVRVVSATAGELRMPVYFVGGLVRDILLGKSPTDLDIVVEGDAIELVRQLQARFGGELHSHSRFGTAKWLVDPAMWAAIEEQAAALATTADERELLRIATQVPAQLDTPPMIDFVTARKEFYKRPTALPDVERGSIKLDLHRRDFTINTLAVRLDGAYLGQLLDFYGGRRDLQRGLIRVLHSLSFIDDPTRILRAVRLEQRLDFAIEPGTADLIAAALPLLGRVSGERVRNEIELALGEADPLRVLRRLDELHVLEQIAPGLHFPIVAEDAIKSIPVVTSDTPWADIYHAGPSVFYPFALWLAHLEPAVQRAAAARLRVRKATGDDLDDLNALRHALAALPETAPVSQVVAALQPYSERVLLTARLLDLSPVINAWLERYVREWRGIRTAVTGDDLKALGLAPGPVFAELLDALLNARLDGHVTTEDEERQLLAALVAERRD
jgi:tRNA nucleotidyltransferase (CCA-adding enzyme)